MKVSISDFTETLLVGVSLIHADRRTDGRINMTNVMVVFRDYSNTANNDSKSRYVSLVRKMRN